MPEPRRILTLHSPIPTAVLDNLLSGVETSLRQGGASRVWIDCRWSPDLHVMAEFGPLAMETLDEPEDAVVPQPR